jgi:hypothetical protein
MAKGKRPLSQGPLLWHYTDFNGLHGMITNEVIRASGIAYLSDAAEFTHTIDIAHQYLRPKTVRLSDLFLPMTRKEVPAFVSKVLAKVRRSGVFVASFSKKRDDLSQWRAYGGAGPGFSLGFARDALELLGTAEQFDVVDCEYDLKKQKEELKKNIEAKAEAMRAAERKIEKNFDAKVREEFFDKWSFELFKVVERVAVRNKSPSFSDEREVRLVMRPGRRPPSLSPLSVRFRQSRSLVVPYVEIPTLCHGQPSPIKQVVVGPCAHSSEVAEAIQQLLAQKHLTAVVKSSSIPFRNW